MSESARAAASGAEGTGSGSPRPARAREQERRGLFARITLFFRQVIAELKKVHWLNRSELLRYTGVVLVFVAVVMAFVTLVDLGVGSLTAWTFGG